MNTIKKLVGVVLVPISFVVLNSSMVYAAGKTHSKPSPVLSEVSEFDLDDAEDAVRQALAKKNANTDNSNIFALSPEIVEGESDELSDKIKQAVLDSQKQKVAHCDRCPKYRTVYKRRYRTVYRTKTYRVRRKRTRTVRVRQRVLRRVRVRQRVRRTVLVRQRRTRVRYVPRTRYRTVYVPVRRAYTVMKRVTRTRTRYVPRTRIRTRYVTRNRVRTRYVKRRRTYYTTVYKRKRVRRRVGYTTKRVYRRNVTYRRVR